MALTAVAKLVDKKELAAVEWDSISKAVTRLFDLKKYPELPSMLPELNEKVSIISNSELGQFIGEYYQEHVLSPCMTKLREEVDKEKNAPALILKMAEVWTQFYTSILSTLLVIFASIQHQQNKLSIRALTLISFRDLVVLSSKFSDTLQEYPGPIPPQIEQMLLVLQSVHHSPPSEKFFILQNLVGKVVENYLPMITRTRFHDNTSETRSSRRAGTMDHVLDGGSMGSSGRRRSLGELDKEDSEEPVTRL